MAQSLFERYGGFSTVRKVVSGFYDKVLESPQLQGYFADVEMRKLIDHQTQFISSIMGGPGSISNDQLRRVHAHLNISDGDFTEAIELLREALEDYEVEDSDIDVLCRDVAGLDAFIVTRRD